MVIKKSFKSKSFNDIGVSLVWLSVLGQEKLVASLSMQAFVQSLFMFSLLFCKLIQNLSKVNPVLDPLCCYHWSKFQLE